MSRSLLMSWKYAGEKCNRWVALIPLSKSGLILFSSMFMLPKVNILKCNFAIVMSPLSDTDEMAVNQARCGMQFGPAPAGDQHCIC